MEKSIQDLIDSGELKDFKEKVLICSDKQLTSLKGIEKFVDVIRFYCSFNQLTSLEGVEKLINLKELYCYHNQLESLKGIENLEKLEKINYSNNPCESKYVGNSAKEIVSNVFTEVHLRSDNDRRGEASIMDTGLFDFKLNESVDVIDKDHKKILDELGKVHSEFWSGHEGTAYKCGDEVVKIANLKNYKPRFHDIEEFIKHSKEKYMHTPNILEIKDKDGYYYTIKEYVNVLPKSVTTEIEQLASIEGLKTGDTEDPLYFLYIKDKNLGSFTSLVTEWAGIVRDFFGGGGEMPDIFLKNIGVDKNGVIKIFDF